MSQKDFEELQNQIEEIELGKNLQDYHAFIYWFIETAFGYDDIKILNSICDGARDKGIDAVLIDPIEFKIIIIQSKYERAGGKKQINENEIKLLASTKTYFDSRASLEAAITNGNQVTKQLMKEAFDLIRKKKYSLELIFISTHRMAPHLDTLVYKTLGFTENAYRIYHFDRIMQLYYDRIRDFTPGLGIYNLPFVDSDKSIIKTSPHKSWIVTVTSEEIRSMISKYKDRLFRKNVRNFLGSSRTNRKIQDTLQKDPNNFWYYNNGITVLCDQANIIMEEGYIRLENPQIVNGCQTVMSIQQYSGELDGEVMVRIIESTDHDFINYLTLYQNSSNPVHARDLKSNDPVQIRLKHEFKRQGYFYEIKRGEDYRSMIKKYPAIKSEFNGRKINNEEIAKLLATIKLDPAVALSSGSEKFFDDYYNEIFPSGLSTFNCLAPYHFLKIIRDTYSGNVKRFFTFEKDWVFKKRALYYVLDFIYQSMRSHRNWERDFVFFYNETSNTDLDKFYKQMNRQINKYYEYVYKSWDRTEIEYYNTYLQSTKTRKKILIKFQKEIDDLNMKTENYISNLIY